MMEHFGRRQFHAGAPSKIDDDNLIPIFRICLLGHVCQYMRLAVHCEPRYQKQYRLFRTYIRPKQLALVANFNFSAVFQGKNFSLIIHILAIKRPSYGIFDGIDDKLGMRATDPVKFKSRRRISIALNGVDSALQSLALLKNHLSVLR